VKKKDLLIRIIWGHAFAEIGIYEVISQDLNIPKQFQQPYYDFCVRLCRAQVELLRAQTSMPRFTFRECKVFLKDLHNEKKILL
jgi:hypothetical protein